jgi:hypothetical protein
MKTYEVVEIIMYIRKENHLHHTTSLHQLLSCVDASSRQFESSVILEVKIILVVELVYLI